MRTLSLSFLFLLVGCMATPEAEFRPCRCDVEICSQESCTFTFQLDESCSGQVPEAEILIDDHIETTVLAPGETVQACSQTEPGETAVIYVRGGTWIWGPIVRKCSDTGGDSFPMVLECQTPE